MLGASLLLPQYSAHVLAPIGGSISSSMLMPPPLTRMPSCSSTVHTTTHTAHTAQGHAFAFDQSSVRITPPSPTARGGVIEFTGTWRGDGQRYQIRLLPVAQGAATGRGVQAHAVPLSIGGRASECFGVWLRGCVGCQGCQMPDPCVKCAVKAAHTPCLTLAITQQLSRSMIQHRCQNTPHPLIVCLCVGTPLSSPYTHTGWCDLADGRCCAHS